MQDCDRRAVYHPIGTPPFHHASRTCGGCGRVGCVVPRCTRWTFTPRQEDRPWMDNPVKKGAESLWRCRHCKATRSTLT